MMTKSSNRIVVITPLLVLLAYNHSKVSKSRIQIEVNYDDFSLYFISYAWNIGLNQMYDIKPYLCELQIIICSLILEPQNLKSKH